MLILVFSDEELAASKPAPSIVTWGILKEKIPWGLLFLLGKCISDYHSLNISLVLLPTEIFHDIILFAFIFDVQISK